MQRDTGIVCVQGQKWNSFLNEFCMRLPIKHVASFPYYCAGIGPNRGIECLRRSAEKNSLEVAEGCSTTAENQIGVDSAVDGEQQLF